MNGQDVPRILVVLGADGCDMLADDGGDATLLIYRAKEFGEKYAKDGSLPDPASADNAELCASCRCGQTKYMRMAKDCHCVIVSGRRPPLACTD